MPNFVVTLTCGALGGGDIPAETTKVVEALDTPTHCTIECVIPVPVDMDAVIGEPATVSALGRQFPLIVMEIAQTDLDQAAGRYQMVLEHPIAKLRFRRDHRKWLGKTVKDVAIDVLKGIGITSDGFDWKATGGTMVRAACLQYGETDYDFLMRLLADEGIFWFCPDGADAKLVFADDASIFAPIPGKSTVPITGEGQGDGLHSIEIENIVTSGAVSLADYDYEHPGVDLTSRAAVDDSPAGELFFYPGGFLTQSDGAAFAKIRAQEIASRKTKIEGASAVQNLCVAGTFTIDSGGAPTDTICVRRVEHHFDIQGYHNTFVAHPSNLPYRPTRNIAKATAGTLVSTITGASGTEISVDKLGRFTAAYAFDRNAGTDDTSSQWIRLSQPMVGGSMFLARVGWEVALHHLEGDPDRPVGVARMYDGTHPPPYKLPDNMTMTAFETLNSTGGDKVNSITIDDKSGAMMFGIIAAKDLDATVVNDETETIKANDTLTVGVDETILIGDAQTVEVDKDESITANKDVGVEVAGDRTKSVTKDETATVQGALAVRVDGDDSESVGQDLSISADKGYLETAKGKYDLTVTGTVTAKSKKDYTIWVGGKSTATIGAGKTTSSSDGALTEAVKGDANLTVGAAWMETVDGERLSTAQGDMERTVGAAGTLTAAGKLQIKGKTVKITVSAAATFVGGGGTFSISPASIAFLGLVTFKGSGGVEVTGMPQMAG